MIIIQEVLQYDKKGGNRLVPDPELMVDSLKLPNQAPESLASSATDVCGLALS